MSEQIFLRAAGVCEALKVSNSSVRRIGLHLPRLVLPRKLTLFSTEYTEALRDNTSSRWSDQERQRIGIARDAEEFSQTELARQIAARFLLSAQAHIERQSQLLEHVHALAISANGIALALGISPRTVSSWNADPEIPLQSLSGDTSLYLANNLNEVVQFRLPGALEENNDATRQATGPYPLH